MVTGKDQGVRITASRGRLNPILRREIIFRMKRKKPKKSSLSTSEVLNRALDELDSAEGRPRRGPRHAAPASPLRKALYTVCAGGLIIGLGYGAVMCFSSSPASHAPEQPAADRSMASAKDKIPVEAAGARLTEEIKPPEPDAFAAKPWSAADNASDNKTSSAPTADNASPPSAAGVPEQPEPAFDEVPPGIPAAAESLLPSDPVGKEPPSPETDPSSQKAHILPEEPVQAEPPPEGEPRREGRYAINAGSYKSREKAESELAKLLADGFKAYIEDVELGRKGVWYRVKVGRFKTLGDAEASQQKLEQKYNLHTFIYSR